MPRREPSSFIFSAYSYVFFDSIDETILHTAYHHHNSFSVFTSSFQRPTAAMSQLSQTFFPRRAISFVLVQLPFRLINDKREFKHRSAL